MQEAHAGQRPLTVAWLLARVALLVGVLLLVPRLLLGCALLVPRLLLAVLRVPCRVEETQGMSAVCQGLSRSLTFPTSDLQSRKLALDAEATSSWEFTASPLSGVRVVAGPFLHGAGQLAPTREPTGSISPQIHAWRVTLGARRQQVCSRDGQALQLGLQTP